MRDHQAQGPRLNATQRQMDLVDQANNWKTPHGMGNIDASGKKGGAGGGEFAKQVNNWNTPTEQDAKHATNSPAQLERGVALVVDALNWPTPNASDTKGTGFERGNLGLRKTVQLWNPDEE